MFNRALTILLVPAVPMFAMDTAWMFDCACAGHGAVGSMAGYHTSGGTKNRIQDNDKECRCCGCCLGDNASQNTAWLPQRSGDLARQSESGPGTSTPHHHSQPNPGDSDPDTDDSRCAQPIGVTAVKAIESSEHSTYLATPRVGKDQSIDTEVVLLRAIDVVDAPTRGPPTLLFKP